MIVRVVAGQLSSRPGQARRKSGTKSPEGSLGLRRSPRWSLRQSRVEGHSTGTISRHFG